MAVHSSDVHGRMHVDLAHDNQSLLPELAVDRRPRMPIETLDDLKGFLAGLSSQRDQQYSNSIRAAVLSHPDFLEELLTRFIREDPDAPTSQREAAYYSLCIGHRRKYNSAYFDRIVREMCVELPQSPISWAMTVEGLLQRRQDQATLEHARGLCLKAMKHLAWPGIPYQMAEISLRLSEFASSDQREILLKDAEKHLDAAQARIDRSNSDVVAPHPKYLALRSQILSRKGRHVEALVAIDEAIASEDSRSSDYALRLGRFQATRVEIVVEERLNRMRQISDEYGVLFEERTAQIQDELRQSRRETIEILALLAAAIAFISVSATLAVRAPVGAGIPLIAAAGGVLILVFGAFGAAIGANQHSLRRSTAIGSLGFALLAIANWVL